MQKIPSTLDELEVVTDPLQQEFNDTILAYMLKRTSAGYDGLWEIVVTMSKLLGELTMIHCVKTGEERQLIIDNLILPVIHSSMESTGTELMDPETMAMYTVREAAFKASGKSAEEFFKEQVKEFKK